MKSQNKKNILIFVTLIFVFLFLLPVFINAQTIDKDVSDKLLKCWTRQQCLDSDVTTGDCTNFDDKTNYCFQTDKNLCGDENLGKCYVKPKPINLQVSIPGVGGAPNLKKVDSFPEYLKIIYTYFVFVIGIIAVAFIGWGGFLWMMAAGSADKIAKAKDTIQGAFIGVLLAVGSYVLLDTINSRLVNIDPLKVARIKPTLLVGNCIDSAFARINDWVLLTDLSGKTSSSSLTKCGETYVSKSNMSQPCRGLDCPINNNTRQYCVPQESGDLECGDKNELAEVCENVKINYPLKPFIAQEFVDTYNQTCKEVSDYFGKAWSDSANSSMGCSIFDKDMGGLTGNVSEKEAFCKPGVFLTIPEYRVNKQRRDSFQYINCTEEIAEDICHEIVEGVRKPNIFCLNKDIKVVNTSYGFNVSGYTKCIMGVFNPVIGGIGYCSENKPDLSNPLFNDRGFIDFDYKEVDNGTFCNNQCTSNQKCWIGVGQNNYEMKVQGWNL